MPKYEVTSPFCLDGRDLTKGQQVTLDERRGEVYRRQGRVKPAGSGPARTPAGKVSTRDPDPQTRGGGKPAGGKGGNGGAKNAGEKGGDNAGGKGGDGAGDKGAGGEQQ